jgi:hypothetical protein
MTKMSMLGVALVATLTAGCAGEADPCASVNCAPGRECLQGRCVPKICSFHSDCPAGTRCVGGGCQPAPQLDGGGDGPSPDGPRLLDAAPPDAAKDLSPCGSCDDKDPCTTDHCAEGVCKHVTPVPATCVNGTVDACEVCEGDKPYGVTPPCSGCKQVCMNCNEVGLDLFMYNLTIPYTTPFSNAHYSATGTQYSLKVTCNGKLVLTRIWGSCENGGSTAIYCKDASGKVHDSAAMTDPTFRQKKIKTCTIGCPPVSGHNKSRYVFLCGPPA